LDSLSSHNPNPVSEQEIRAELARLLASREFAHASRLCSYLTFVVERTLAGDRDSLKESVIGTVVYNRAPGYDPKAEPIVRTEARRLRAKLSEHYAGAGRDSRIHISIPTGGYVASFDVRSQPSPRLAVMPAPPTEKAGSPKLSPHSRLRYTVWLAPALAVLAAAGLLFLRRSARNRSEFVLSTVTSYPGAQHTPAISRDGRQVVFTWSDQKTGEDIYVAGADGGAPKRLTNGHAGDRFPAWSNDGTQIAFIRAETLLVMSPSGGGERALGRAHPSGLSWSPDDKTVLVSDWTRSPQVLALFAVDLASGSRRQITFPPAGIIADGDRVGALSPDGRRLAFIRCSLGNCDLYASDYGRAEVQRLTRDECSFAGLSWMPDGRSIVYSSRRRGPYMLWLVNASGGEPQQVAGDDARYPRTAHGLSKGARIVFEHRVNIGSIWSQRLNPELAQAASSNLPQRLTASTSLDSSPQLSPNGKRIVFSSDRTGYDEIWAADADGGNQRVLTHMRKDAGSPRWSPDGNRIAFDLLTTNGRAIFLIDTNGAVPQQWTPWSNAARPSWSRDGRWIYFASNDPAGKSQVWKISTAPDRAIQQVTRDGGFEAFESLDGATLYYTTGSSELRRMPVSGGVWARMTPRPVRHGWWSVSQNGIYFADLPDPKDSVYDEAFPVMLLDFDSGNIRKIASIHGPVNRSTPDFTTSVDGLALFYCLLEVSTSQIRMLEAL
jgi:Tol biopolymer transport system component